MHYRSLALSLTAFTLVACGSTNLTTTGPKMPPRGEQCEFQLLTASPAGGFVELGTIDVQPGMFGSGTFTNLSSFKREIAPYVCEAGGDAVLAAANGFGMYIKATVLKSEAPGAQATAAPDPTASGGCKFDTQCKGDRICTKGECVAPAKN